MDGPDGPRVIHAGSVFVGAHRMDDSHVDDNARETEQHYRCPHCKNNFRMVPRFLAAASRGLVGTLRIKCPKCRHDSVFALETGAILSTVPPRSRERELRCGACSWFVAGIHVTSGDGFVRAQCPVSECKRQNRFICSATEAKAIEVPIG